MQLAESLTEGASRPHRSWLFKMFFMKDKGSARTHKKRPSIVTCDRNARWDAISATSEVLMSTYPPPYGVHVLLQQDLHKVVLFPSDSDRTKPMPAKSMRENVKKHFESAGYKFRDPTRPRNISEGIKMLAFLFHAIRNKQARQLLNHPKISPEAADRYLHAAGWAAIELKLHLDYMICAAAARIRSDAAICT